MFKPFFCMLIFSLCALCGFLLSAKYSARVKYLNDLTDSLRLLRSEMMYRRDPLPETFAGIGVYKTNSASAFFRRLNEILREGKIFRFRDCWEKALRECYADSSLKCTDIEIIKDVGIELGKSDLAGQNDLFFRIFERLEECKEDAVLERNTKGKMYGSMGITIGIILVIILI